MTLSSYADMKGAGRMNTIKLSISVLCLAVMIAIFLVTLPWKASTQTQDTTPPQLAAFSYSPMSIDTSSGSQTVTVTARITDNPSGFSVGILNFISPSRRQSRSRSFQYPNNLTSGTAQDGTYQLLVSFPQFSEAGTWHLDYIDLSDQAGNRIVLTETDLINLGFQTTLEVAQNRLPVAMCRNVTAAAGSSGTANASINNGSFDPDSGDTITINQSPAGPYALGVTNVTLTVTDNHGGSSSCSATVSVVDTTAPTISCPAPITLDGSNSSGGAVVNFSVTATDNCDSSPSVSVTPPSGSLFSFGTRTVTATATDDSGNSSQCSFSVTVRTPQNQATQMINQVQALVTGGTLTQNQGAGLTDKLNQVITKLNQGQINAACNQLSSFINQVNAFISNGSLTPAQGQALITAANALGTNIGC